MKSPRSARPRRRRARPRNERLPDQGSAKSAVARRRRGARRLARRLRRRGAPRARGRAQPAHQGCPRPRGPAAPGAALRARALYGGIADRPVPARAHRRREDRRRREREQIRPGSEPAQGAARVISARVDPDARHDHAKPGNLRSGEGRPELVPGEERQLHGAELRRHHRNRRRPDQPQGARAGRRRGLGRALQRAATGGGKTMKITKTFYTAFYSAALWLAGAGIAAAQTNSIEAFDVTQQGDKVVVRITTKEPLKSVPPNFSTASPARLVFDFPNSVNALGRAAQAIGQGDLRSMNVVQGGDRTRLVLNLRRSVPHEASIDGRTVVINFSAPAVVQATPGTQPAQFAEGRADATHAVREVDFRRGRAGEGRVIVDLSDTNTGIDIRTQGPNIIVEFLKTSLPENLRRRLDVTDFATPVEAVNVFQQGDNVRMVIEPKGQWEHNAYQSDTQFVVEVKPVVLDPSRATQKGRYTGEKLSLNFQNVEVRAVLNVIADFTDLNIITSDTVAGNITLRLKDVPWDQALEIGEVRDHVQHRAHFDVLEVERELLTRVAALLGGARGIQHHRLDLDHELRVRLVGVVLPLAFRLDHHAHVVALLEHVHGFDRRGEVGDVEPAAQVLGERGLEELHDDVRSLRADVDAGIRIRQVDHDAALACPAAAESHLTHGTRCLGP